MRAKFIVLVVGFISAGFIAADFAVFGFISAGFTAADFAVFGFASAGSTVAYYCWLYFWLLIGLLYCLLLYMCSLYFCLLMTENTIWHHEMWVDYFPNDWIHQML